jgi:hypothetical protein
VLMQGANTIRFLLVILGFTGVLVACSSGGSDSDSSPTSPPAATTAEELWNGTTSSGRTVAGLVLDETPIGFSIP